MLNVTEYAGLLVFTIFGIAFICGVFLLSAIFREHGERNAERSSVYECGLPTIGSSYVSPNIRFYVFALLFVVFDIEAAFILPWAVKFKTLGLLGFMEMIVFIAILFVGLIYAWRKGALKWE